MSVRLAANTVEYVRVPVRAKQAGVIIDPTAFPVSFGYTSSTTTQPTVWYPADWEQGESHDYARILVGTTGVIDPGAGTWALWLKVNASPEVPVKFAGTVVIA